MDEISKLNGLVDLLKEKKRLLIDMKELTKCQTGIIAGDKIDSLNLNINNKESIIKKIDLIDEEFGSIYNLLKEKLNVSSLEKSEILPKNLLKELKAQTTVVTELIGEIIVIDDENRKKANDLKNRLAEEMRIINTSKQANAIYRGLSSYQGSYFIDKKK